MPLPYVENLCGAKTRKGTPCANPAMPNGRCRMHRGKAAKGFAAPSFKTGKHSKYINHLPDAKREQFTRNAEFNNKVDISEEISITTTHLQELLELLEDATLIEKWKEILTAVAALGDAINNDGLNSRLTPAQAFEQLTTRIDSVSAGLKLWGNIHALTEKITKMSEAHAKIQSTNLDLSIKLNKHVPVEFVRAFMDSCGAVFDQAPEPLRTEQLQALQRRFEDLPDAVKGEPKQLTQ
jgi:hypothetical protein